VEVLLSYPQAEEIIPWNSLDGEAWHTLLCEDPQYAKYVHWEKINKWRKKSLAHIYPEMEIPSIPALPGLDKHPPIIQKVSPLVIYKNSIYNFCARDVKSGIVFSASLNVYELFRSLRMETDCKAYLLTCGPFCCPQCAGFWYERVRQTKTLIHWTIGQTKHDIELYFDRDIYEKSAVELLIHLQTKPHIWNSFSRAPKRKRESFEIIFQKLLKEKPRLLKFYQEIKSKNDENLTLPNSPATSL
jgi:hypothetical protein